jgi:hypothetical protein
MKKLLLATTILTSLSTLTLADSNNDYYFRLLPEFTMEEFTIDKIDIQKTPIVEDEVNRYIIDANKDNNFTLSQKGFGTKIEFGTYLNDYLALGISSSIHYDALGGKGNFMYLDEDSSPLINNSFEGSFGHLNFKIMPKLNLIAYNSDDITISLGAGVGYHYKNLGLTFNLNDKVKHKEIKVNPSLKFHGIVGAIDLNIVKNINSTTSIGLDLGVTYSKLFNNQEIDGLPSSVPMQISTKISGSSIAYSIGLSAKFSL